MKIRAGFVSNSSSSSFVVFGTRINWNKVKEVMEKEKISLESQAACEWVDNRVVGDDLCYRPQEGLIGIEPNNMEDSETKRNFCRRVAERVSKVLGYAVTVDDIEFIIEEVWD